MQKEIETRFLEVDKKALVKKLLALGAEDKGEELLEETIFHAADGSWQYKFIRLRKKGNKTHLTYKTNPKQKINSALEIDFEVSDHDKCADFFKQLGLAENRRLEKYRHTLKLGKVTVDIDTWPKVPTYAEFEGPSVAAIKKVTDKLGLDWKKKFDGDAREVFKHYGYDMNKLAVITRKEWK